MSETLLPLEGGRAGAARPSIDLKSGGEIAQKARLAKASREFQALFLMELMKPLTEGMTQNSLGSAELGTGDRELYSWFWSEGLAKQLAGSWPLPQLPGTDRPASSTTQARPLSLPSSGPTFRPLTTPSATAPAAAAPAPARPSPEKTEAKGETSFDPLIERASSLFQLPANLVRAVIRVESSGQADSVSSKGATGLMQVMPATAKEMGVRDPSDPWENLYAGVKYLSQQISRFGNLAHALAAYNAGPGAVAEHQGVPPYPETRAYVRRVLEEKARLDLSRPADA